MTGSGTTGERHVLLAGGTSDAGWAIARTLRTDGTRVTIAGRSAEKLAAFADEGFGTMRVDLSDADAVDRAIDGLERLDGLFPLVGGWRGGGGISGQSDADWRSLEIALTAVRHTCRAAWPLLDASPAARVAVISSTAVTRPLAGGANYAAVKAATEAWIQALAHGFEKSARDAGRTQAGACTIFRVKVLSGLEETIATRFAALWNADPTGPGADVVTLETAD
ncbi:SDR family oxidoreductase [Microbacterium suaedae]|uniref:SDR family oxidoreductase n=1 Tax=Microbacterium suaedae TaxID=2067813 RepID=UPI000DA1F500|nr:SDR family oxidoreductase [Microbacterium suaedae]